MEWHDVSKHYGEVAVKDLTAVGACAGVLLDGVDAFDPGDCAADGEFCRRGRRPMVGLGECWCCSLRCLILWGRST